MIAGGPSNHTLTTGNLEMRSNQMYFDYLQLKIRSNNISMILASFSILLG